MKEVYSRITGTGSYLPSQRVSNKDLEKWVETTDEWIFERTGIRFRHLAGNDDTAATMGTAAARAALSAAQLDAKQIDMIIVATATPDYVFPNTACLIQKALGCAPCAAFDISVACTGFCYALSLADNTIKAGMAQHILVIGAEVISRMLDWNDRSTCVLFGDGAGALVLSASSRPGLILSKLKADGQYADILSIANLQNLRGEKAISPYLQMQGRELFKLAVTKGSEIVRQTLAELPSEYQTSITGTNRVIDWLLPHQANLRIIKVLAEQLQLPMDRVLLSLEEQGNTSAASIPLALDEGVRLGKIKEGDRLLLIAFGGGFTWASNFICY